MSSMLILPVAVIILGLMAVPGIGVGRVTATGAQAQAGQQSAWTRVQGLMSDTVRITGVFMVSADDAWVSAGSGGTGLACQLRWDGISWRRTLCSPALRAPLNAVVAVSDDNVWAVGDDGLIVHREGDVWREVPPPAQGYGPLYALQMLGDGSEGWAGGQTPAPAGKPLLLHYSNGQWQVDPSVRNTTYSLPVRGLHFAASDAGYAVGGPLGWRYSGGGWTQDNIPCRPAGYGCSTQLTAVRTISGEEAWAVGASQPVGGAGSAVPQILALHRTSGQWQEVLPAQQLADEPTGHRRLRSSLNAISFSRDNYGLAVGWQSADVVGDVKPLVISYRQDGRWHYDDLPADAQGALNAVSQYDSSHALAVGDNGLILAYGYGYAGSGGTPTATPAPAPSSTPSPSASPVPTRTRLPTERVTPPVPPDPAVLYFDVVGHTLRGRFRQYWQEHGGLMQFGYPLTEEFEEVSPTDGRVYTVQYFERARFEHHPENRPPYDVLLGLLGRTVTSGREQEDAFRPAPPQAGPGVLYFRETGHNLAPRFAAYWQSHGALPVYGYPISEEFEEVSPTDGRVYTVQYFERARFEYHPELPAQYRVSLGLLGAQILRGRGWLP